jgi:hypothetical protein
MKPNLRILIACSFLFIFICCANNTAFSSVTVPLIVQEALPASVTGIQRTAEIATGGIPLPDGTGITSISQLGLTGTSVGQFRALGYWPSGNIKWVLVDFPVSLSADATNSAVALVNGAGNFGGSNLSVDNGATISVATGAATFTVRKSNFNIFDTVSVGSTLMVASGNSGRLHLIGGDNVDYSSSNDAGSTAIIEENGPVRTVIKATGALISSTGVRLLDYTVRLHFYKGKSQVKGVITIRNASQTNANVVQQFKSIEAVVPVLLGSSKTLAFGRYSSGVQSTTNVALPSATTAYLFQGYKDIGMTTNQVDFTVYGGPTGTSELWTTPLPVYPFQGWYAPDPSYYGLKILVGSSTVKAFGNKTNWSNSVASITDGTGAGVSLVYRGLSDYWPGGFEFKDSGSTSIELYSKYNDGANKGSTSTLGPLYLHFGMHDTREVMWNFYTGVGNDQAARYALEYPLTVLANLNQYNTTNCLLGSTLTTTSQETNFFNTESKTASPLNAGAPSQANIDAPIIRGWFWGSQGGGFMQQNYVGSYLTKWLRTGQGGYYLLGKNRAIMEINSAIYRMDDFNDPTKVTPANPNNVLYPLSITSGQADGEHRYLYTIPIYYYLTGDEDAKDAFQTLGNYLINTTYYPLGSEYLRAAGNALRDAVTAYEFSCETGSCNSALLTTIETELGSKIDSREDVSHRAGFSYYGRNLNRGYLYWDDDYNTAGFTTLRYAHSLYHNQVYFDSVWQAWRVAKSAWWNYSRLNELEDYMTGMAKFYLEEWYKGPPLPSEWGIPPYYFSQPPFNGTYGQLYNIWLDQATTDASVAGVSYMSPLTPVSYSLGRASLWAYSQSPQQKYLNAGYAAIWENANMYGTDEQRNAAELQDQTLMSTYFNGSLISIWQPLSLSVQDNGGGSYTLTWTVPIGTTNYRIKYSSTPIVEWLGFNSDTRTYQFDPTQYTAFFAANNISNNPAPATPGTVQSITLTGLPLGQQFAAKYLAPTVAPSSPRNLKILK